MRFLLDTDCCVDVLRGVPAVIARLKLLSPDDCVISAITAFELFAGAGKARNSKQESAKVQTLLRVVQEAPFESRAARQAGQLRAHLESLGRLIGPYDLLIAAHALALDLTLITANQAEFERVAGLRCESWR